MILGQLRIGARHTTYAALMMMMMMMTGIFTYGTNTYLGIRSVSIPCAHHPPHHLDHNRHPHHHLDYKPTPQDNGLMMDLVPGRTSLAGCSSW